MEVSEDDIHNAAQVLAHSGKTIGDIELGIKKRFKKLRPDLPDDFWENTAESAVLIHNYCPKCGRKNKVKKT